MLFDAVTIAHKELGIDCGVIHTECRIVNGSVKILEVNPRLIGDMAGSHMIEIATGTSPIEYVVEISLNNFKYWEKQKESYAVLYGVLMPKTGVFKSIVNEEYIKKIEGVKIFRTMATVGNVYSYPPKSNVDIIVRLITEAESLKKAKSIAEYAALNTVVEIGE